MYTYQPQYPIHNNDDSPRNVKLGARVTWQVLFNWFFLEHVEGSNI